MASADLARGRRRMRESDGQEPTFDRGILPPLCPPLALRMPRRFVSRDKVPAAPSIARRTPRKTTPSNARRYGRRQCASTGTAKPFSIIPEGDTIIIHYSFFIIHSSTGRRALREAPLRRGSGQTKSFQIIARNVLQPLNRAALRFRGCMIYGFSRPAPGRGPSPGLGVRKQAGAAPRLRLTSSAARSGRRGCLHSCRPWQADFWRRWQNSPASRRTDHRCRRPGPPERDQSSGDS